MSDFPDLEAIARLIEIAKRDTGQSKKVADFLLAWHNAEENGGWDPTDLWAVDEHVAGDMLTVLEMMRCSSKHGKYPNDLGFQREISQIWELWRGSR